METIMCNQRKIGGIFVQLILAAHQGRGGHYGNEDENPNGNKIIYRFRQAEKRSSHFFFPSRLFNKAKALTMDKVRGNINGYSFATSPCPSRRLIIR